MQLLLEQVVLHVDEHAHQDFDLELGDVSTIVPVQVDAGILQTESGEVRI